MTYFSIANSLLDKNETDWLFDPFLTWNSSDKNLRTTVRKEDGYVEIDIDMPGVKREELSVTCDDKRLTVKSTGERKIEKTYSLNYTQLDTANTQAKLDLGVLTVRIPVAKAKSKKIAIQ
jgi:HSP20 family molecular chaperone IbpA